MVKQVQHLNSSPSSCVNSTVAPQAQTTPAVEAVVKQCYSNLAEGEPCGESPLVGVAYLAAGPDKT